MSFDGLLKQTAEFFSQTASQDAIGGQVIATASVLASWPCRVRVLKAEERLAHQQQGVDVAAQLFCRIPDPDTVVLDETMIAEVDSMIYKLHSVVNIQGHHLKIMMGYANKKDAAA